jgi:hypothetical protein
MFPLYDKQKKQKTKLYPPLIQDSDNSNTGLFLVFVFIGLKYFSGVLLLLILEKIPRK